MSFTFFVKQDSKMTSKSFPADSKSAENVLPPLPPPFLSPKVELIWEFYLIKKLSI